MRWNYHICIYVVDVDFNENNVLKTDQHVIEEQVSTQGRFQNCLFQCTNRYFFAKWQPITF